MYIRIHCTLTEYNVLRGANYWPTLCWSKYSLAYIHMLGVTASAPVAPMSDNKPLLTHRH